MSSVSTPSYAAGQVVNNTDVNNFFMPSIVMKTSDTSRASTTTATSDPDLTLPLAANAWYVFTGYLDYEGGTQGASDLKFQWSIPASATLRYQEVGVGSGGGQTDGNTFATGATTAGTQGAGNLCGVSMNGSVITGGTAGNFTLQWAQNTSSGTATIVHAQSWLSLQRVA